MKYVAYYRVSTKKQDLGIDAQMIEVRQFVERDGGTVVAEYTEVESGRKNDRPQLQAALSHVKLANATLLVAKLDRLSRNVAFLSALMESRVNFVCCDNPHATPFILHVLVANAQREAEQISARTKAALQALKARGVKLGSARPGHWREREHLRGFRQGSAASAAAKQERTSAFRSSISPRVAELQARGLTLRQIADELNGQGFETQARNPWTGERVRRLLREIEGRGLAG